MPSRPGTPHRLDHRDLRRGLEALVAEVEGVAGLLEIEQLVWRPGPDRWSVADILDHLTATALRYDDAIRHTLAVARAAGLTGGGVVALRWWERLFLGTLEPPPRRRFRAPEVFQPSRAGVDPSAALPSFLSAHRRILAALQEADGLDLRGARVVSPANRWMRPGLGAAFAILAAHGRRHLWQAHRVVGSPAFPPGSRTPAGRCDETPPVEPRGPGVPG